MKKYIFIIALTVACTAAVFHKWEDVKVIVGGHAMDAYSRMFGEHMVMEGNTFKSGVFDESASGQDAAHWATGTAALIISDSKRYVQLNKDFKSGPIPDGHVYVSVTKDINNEADFMNSKQIEVGKLVNSLGASYYELPKGVVVNSVTIWCKQFNKYIGSADFGRAQAA